MCTVLSHSLHGLLLHTGNSDIFSIQISWSVHAVLIKSTTFHTKKSFCRPWWGLLCCADFIIVSTQMWQCAFSSGRSKIQSVLTNRLTGSSHIKALFEAVCGLWICLLARSFSEMSFFLLLQLIVWQRHYHSMSSWFWVDSLITWKKTEDVMSRGVSDLKQPILKWLQARSTWPSLVSMVLMRTFFIAVVSMWGLKSIIVSEEENNVLCYLANTSIPGVKSTSKQQSYLSGLVRRSLAGGWRFYIWRKNSPSVTKCIFAKSNEC